MTRFISTTCFRNWTYDDYITKFRNQRFKTLSYYSVGHFLILEFTCIQLNVFFVCLLINFSTAADNVCCCCYTWLHSLSLLFSYCCCCCCWRFSLIFFLIDPPDIYFYDGPTGKASIDYHKQRFLQFSLSSRFTSLHNSCWSFFPTFKPIENY